MFDALHTLLYWFLMLMIYSFIGWVYESTLCSITGGKLVNRGFLTGPVCPVYGFGALLVLFTLGDVEGVMPLFLSAAVLTCTVEYITSWLLEKLFHAKWWDYSSHRFNIHGRVCLEGAIVFGLLSVLLIKVVHPRVAEFVGRFSEGTVMIVAAALFAIFCADLLDTVHSLLVMNGRMAEIQAALDKYRTEMEEIGQELRDLLAESKAEFKLRSEIAVEELLIALEEREAKRQTRMSELKAKLAQRFEESEFNTRRVNDLCKKRRWQERRLLRAFPEMKSNPYGAALEELRKRLEEKNNQ